jgi:methylthioribose-1-phosphate isomerase
MDFDRERESSNGIPYVRQGRELVEGGKQSWVMASNSQHLSASSQRSRTFLKVLNQLLLPEVSEYVEIHGVEDGYAAIKGMIVSLGSSIRQWQSTTLARIYQVRGAPLIATVGMLSLVVDLYHRMEINQLSFTTEQFISEVCEKCDYLVSARPTAVNLSNVAHQLKAFVRDLSGGTSAWGMREK